MSRLHELAGEAARDAMARGFAPVTWEILPGRVMMIVTELDELRHAEDVGPELADVVIRTVGLLHVLFPGWRLLKSPPLEDVGRRGRLSLEAELWPVIHFCTECVHAWRRGEVDRVGKALEWIVWECYRLAHVLSVDLMREVEAKVAINRTRPYRHGALEAL